MFLSLPLLPRSGGELHEFTPVHPQLAILWVVGRELYFMIFLGWKFASPLLYPPRVWQVPGFRLPLFESPEMSQALSVPSSDDQKWNSAPSPSSLVCHLAPVPKWGWSRKNHWPWLLARTLHFSAPCPCPLTSRKTRGESFHSPMSPFPQSRNQRG